VSEEGTFAELNSNRGYVYDLFRKRVEDHTIPEDRPRSNILIAFGNSPDETAIAGDTGVSRQAGDLGVYTYYFSSIGLKTTITFILLEVAFAALSKLPGNKNVSSTLRTENTNKL
jgi:hypothetical protein